MDGRDGVRWCCSWICDCVSDASLGRSVGGGLVEDLSTRLLGVILRLESELPCARGSPAAAAILRHKGRLSSSEATAAMADSELEPLDRAAGRDDVVGMEEGVVEEEAAFGNVTDRGGPAVLFGSTIPGCIPPPPGAGGRDRFVGFGEGVLVTDFG